MEVVRFIENVVNSLDYTITINSSTNDGTYTTLLTDATKQARKGSIITIDGTEYTVYSFINNTSITITGLPSSPTLGTLEVPNYFHGTAKATNAELGKIVDNSLKFPFIYCYEIIPERFYDAPDSIIDRDAEIRLYFLDNANFADWTTEEHYDNVIDAMKNLQKLMIAKFKSCSSVGLLDSHDTINHVKFGVWEENGHSREIFDDNLSGVELTMTLPLLKEFCDPCDDRNLVIDSNGTLVIDSNSEFVYS